MNLNVYLDDELFAELERYVAQRKVSRNSAIREAIKALVQSKSGGWSSNFLNFKGVPDFEPFEKAREGHKYKDLNKSFLEAI